MNGLFGLYVAACAAEFALASPEISGRSPARWIGVNGLETDERANDAVAAVAAFARSNPGVPAETLYRFARGCDLHDGAHDGFLALGAEEQLAWEIFARVIAAVDEAVRVVAARPKLEAGATERGPIYAAALSERPEDTILEQHPDPLATNDHMVLRRTDEIVGEVSPALAEDDGRGGDDAGGQTDQGAPAVVEASHDPALGTVAAAIGADAPLDGGVEQSVGDEGEQAEAVDAAQGDEAEGDRALTPEEREVFEREEDASLISPAARAQRDAAKSPKR